MHRLTSLVALAAIVAGCSLQHVKLYDGPDRPASEHSTLSSVGLYPERELSLTVLEVDGKSIADGRAASYRLSGDLISVYFEDKGPSFPEECL